MQRYVKFYELYTSVEPVLLKDCVCDYLSLIPFSMLSSAETWSIYQFLLSLNVIFII